MALPPRKKQRQLSQKPLPELQSSSERPADEQFDFLSFVAAMPYEVPVGIKYKRLARTKDHTKKKSRRVKVFMKREGREARLAVDAKDRIPLHMADVQKSLLFAVFGSYNSLHQPGFCRFKNQTHISHAVLVLIHGVTVDDFRNAVQNNIISGLSGPATNGTEENVNEDVQIINSVLPKVSNITLHFELLAPSRYCQPAVLDLLSMAVTKREKLYLGSSHIDQKVKSGELLRVNPTIMPISLDSVAGGVDTGCRSSSHKPLDRRKLLLTKDQMRDLGYPLEDADGCEEYKHSLPSYSEVTSRSPMFALDCEMRKSQYKKVLTAVAVVDESLKTIYYRPRGHVDINTVQEDICALLPSDAVLVGHSLDSDLHTLRILHPYIIDTAAIYNVCGSHKTSSPLRVLSEIFLRENIQEGKKHDPSEDARASMKLTQLKLSKGIGFGMNVQLNNPLGLVLNQEATFERLPLVRSSLQSDVQSSEVVKNLFHEIKQQLDRDFKALHVTTQCGTDEFRKHLGDFYDDYMTTELTTGNKHTSKVVASKSGQSVLTVADMLVHQDPNDKANAEQKFLKFRKLDKQLYRIYEGASDNALVAFVFTGSSLCVPSEQRKNGVFLLCVKS